MLMSFGNAILYIYISLFIYIYTTDIYNHLDRVRAIQEFQLFVRSIRYKSHMDTCEMPATLAPHTPHYNLNESKRVKKIKNIVNHPIQVHCLIQFLTQIL